ncbi:MAG: acetyl-CoA carboxylase, biotin carboxyl carrier protein [Elusimicrobiota bacterium]|jgi:acetyl-CoA carboxylase biotin carboxyl carrier protein|nr:acetyl-CoA carboxylase, biotin carboxyl carrier protein [Elusimicrobiota bacterium]
MAKTNNNNEVKEKLKTFYDIMTAENLEELEIDSKEYSVHIKRKNVSLVKAKNQSLPAQVIRQDPASKFSADENKEQVLSKAASTITGETIKSPITGMFYRSPAPAIAPFVAEGDIVESGKTLCIVEAMKVMNEIKAPFKVKIIKILLENSKAVKTGQDLFSVEKI